MRKKAEDDSHRESWHAQQHGQQVRHAIFRLGEQAESSRKIRSDLCGEFCLQKRRTGEQKTGMEREKLILTCKPTRRAVSFQPALRIQKSATRYEKRFAADRHNNIQ